MDLETNYFRRAEAEEEEKAIHSVNIRDRRREDKRSQQELSTGSVSVIFLPELFMNK